MGEELHRRAFLVASGRTVLAGTIAWSGRPALARAQTLSRDGMEQRVAAIVEAYDSQGNHRTATAADNISAEWLMEEIRQAGLEPSLEPFTVTRIDPLSCHLRVAGRRIEGVPLFDATFTDETGIRGTLGLLGDDADIAVVETEPFTLLAVRSCKRVAAGTRASSYSLGEADLDSSS